MVGTGAPEPPSLPEYHRRPAYSSLGDLTPESLLERAQTAERTRSARMTPQRVDVAAAPSCALPLTRITTALRSGHTPTSLLYICPISAPTVP
jgi:hypothetical protein